MFFYDFSVHPNEGLKEGDSMTVLCIALGTPTPTVTLYLGTVSNLIIFSSIKVAYFLFSLN